MDEREIEKIRNDLTKALKDYCSQEEIERFVQEVISSKKKITLEETCKKLSERKFMTLLELDNTMTIEEKLQFYYKNCDPDYARKTNEWRYQLMADTCSEEEFLEKAKYDATITEEEKREFYYKQRNKN